MSSQIIAVVNQKGGVGKTTTAVNLSAVFAVMNKKTLLIDIDSQGNSSSGLGVKQQDRNITVYHVICKLHSMQEAIIATEIPKLDIVVSNNNLAAIEVEMAGSKNYYQLLSDAIDSIKGEYEYIVIDCPPSLGMLTINALACCSQVIIPMLCDFYSLEGLSHLLKTIKMIEKKINPQIVIGGILFTMYDKRNKLTEQVEQDVRGYLGHLVFNTTIPRNIKLSEAPSHGKAAVIYDHKCSGSKAYIDLVKEILDK